MRMKFAQVSMLGLVLIGGVSCGPADKDCPPVSTSAASAKTAVPPTAKPTMSDGDAPGHHAQAPVLKGGGLEDYPFFYAALGANGTIVPEAGSVTNTGTQIRAATPESDTYTFGETLTYEPSGYDPCVRFSSAGGGGEIAKPTLYRIRDGNGRNLCRNEVMPLTEADELDRCAPGESPQRKVDAFNSVQGLAIAVKGRWKDGKYSDAGERDRSAKEAITLACISGVIAKCVHWGYVPWASYKDSNVDKSLTDHHQACILAAMADYNGNGESYTCTSTIVDIFDTIHIQEEDKTRMSLESLWNRTGKVCMTRSRYDGCGFAAEAHGCDGQYGLVGVRSDVNRIPPSGSPKCPRSSVTPDNCDYR